ncbi:unnamed protein product [Merluccius merluccius]
MKLTSPKRARTKVKLSKSKYNNRVRVCLVICDYGGTMGKIFQVIVIGFNGEKMTIELCNTEEQMQAITVLQLKSKIAERLPGSAGDSMEAIRLIFTNKQMEDGASTLVSYGIQHMSIIQMVMRVPGGVLLSGDQ